MKETPIEILFKFYSWKIFYAKNMFQESFYKEEKTSNEKTCSATAAFLQMIQRCQPGVNPIRYMLSLKTKCDINYWLNLTSYKIK